MARPLRSNPEALKRPTMLDVARLAGGVHPSTVSLVLRNSPNISETTRKRVLAAVRKVGYRRDPLLDAYNHHRMGVIPHKSEPIIACVSDLESRESADKRDPHCSFLRGARKAADNLHCRLELFFIGKSQLSPERLNGILHARGISALLILALSDEVSKLPFSWEEFSALKIESHHLPLPRLCVASDQRQSARLGLRSLISLGYSRVGLLLRSALSNASQDLVLAGHLLEQSLLPITQQIPPLLLPRQEAEGDVARVNAWLTEHKIDAVIGENTAIAQLLPKAGYGSFAPAFASLDLAGAPANWAGIQPDHERVGAQAVEQLVSLMRANQRGPAAAEACTYVPVQWRHAASAPLHHLTQLVSA